MESSPPPQDWVNLDTGKTEETSLLRFSWFQRIPPINEEPEDTIPAAGTPPLPEEPESEEIVESEEIAEPESSSDECVGVLDKPEPEPEPEPESSSSDTEREAEQKRLIRTLLQRIRDLNQENERLQKSNKRLRDIREDIGKNPKAHQSQGWSASFHQAMQSTHWSSILLSFILLQAFRSLTKDKPQETI